jgi:hypothetical protein
LFQPTVDFDQVIDHETSDRLFQQQDVNDVVIAAARIIYICDEQLTPLIEHIDGGAGTDVETRFGCL